MPPSLWDHLTSSMRATNRRIDLALDARNRRSFHIACAERRRLLHKLDMLVTGGMEIAEVAREPQ